MNRLLTIVILFTLVIATSSCGGARAGSPPPPSMPSVSISPSSVTAGSSDLTLTVVGSNFVAGTVFSQAVWAANGKLTPLATTFNSTSQLTAVIPSALLTNPVSATVYIRNWDHIEDVTWWKSAPVPFNVVTEVAGPPMITSISPSSTLAGSRDLVVTIAGSSLVPTQGHECDIVVWSVNGSETFLTPTSFTNSLVTVSIPRTLLRSAVQADVRIEVHDCREFPEDPPHVRSNFLPFTVTAPADASTLPAAIF